MTGNEGDREAAKETERSGAVGGSRRSRTRAEVESAVDDLIACYGSFAASAVSEQVTSVGERTVRRYLSDMVKEGKLVSARAVGRQPIGSATSAMVAELE